MRKKLEFWPRSRNKSTPTAGRGRSSHRHLLYVSKSRSQVEPLPTLLVWLISDFHNKGYVMRVLIVAVKTISLNIKLSKFELKIHIHTLFACIFTATEYFLYYFFKNPTVFIKLLTKSHYVD